jgi:hypothetical protein
MVRLNRDEPEAGPMLEWVLEQVRSGAARPERRPNGNGRLAGPIRPSRSRTTSEGPDPASGVGNGKEPAQTPAPSSAPEPAEGLQAAGLDELRKAEAAAPAASGPDGAHAGEEAASENGEAEHLGPIRRPDTIEDYLL